MNVPLEQLASALVVLTQKNTIRWHCSDRNINKLFDGGTVDGHIYESDVYGKTVLIFRYAYDYTDEYDHSHRDYSFRLEVLGEDQPEMEADGKYNLSILYDVVREASHNVDEWAQEVVGAAQK